jgi:2-hydroxy-3-keto-5-methylthiopentenyl-1-phosphate phosphatase
MSPKFILDFDGTITAADTTNTLANYALAFQSLHYGKDLTAAWENAVKAYLIDVKDFSQSYRPAEGQRTTLEQEVLYLRALRDAEERSFQRVSTLGLFAGIELEKRHAFGREAVKEGEVAIRDGFMRFTELVGGKWGIVSVNFSGKFIEGTIGKFWVEDVEIAANEACVEKGVIRGPKAEGVMCTSDRKLLAMQAMLESWGGEEEEQVVYIGDSKTDIECLVQEGVVGIVMTVDGRGSLMETLERVGVKVRHIGEYRKTEAWRVFYASDFHEISAALFS